LGQFAGAVKLRRPLKGGGVRHIRRRISHMEAATKVRNLKPSKKDPLHQAVR
jgi:hypothetical protein